MPHRNSTKITKFDNGNAHRKVRRLRFESLNSTRICRFSHLFVLNKSSPVFDFLKVDGNIYVGYNMGLTDHVIGELFTKVNDGKYHIVRFVRNGANSTIQVDNLPLQPKNPPGMTAFLLNFMQEERAMSIFNV